jgi:hypothetical protein
MGVYFCIEELHVQGCNCMQSGEQQPGFPGIILPVSSGLQSESDEKSTRRTVFCLLRAKFLLALLASPED